MLVKRLRLLPNITATLIQCLLFVGIANVTAVATAATSATTAGETTACNILSQVVSQQTRDIE